LGLDSAVGALKAVILEPKGPYLASNPWTAVALRLLGRRRVAVTGIYAEEGTRSFRLLRKVLGDIPVVTLVRQESEAWNAAGGNAASVLYGNTFDYPICPASAEPRIRIFIGGSSDRDPELIEAIEQEVKTDQDAVDLIVVAAEEPSSWVGANATITHTGYVPAQQFGSLVASADVVYLPLRLGQRAAGHMVTVGALESGIPVLSRASQGMEGYIDGEFVRIEDEGTSRLSQLTALGRWGRDRRSAIRMYWESTFSHPAYVRRVRDAIRRLTVTS
jgi:hypothetical protein